MPHNDITMDGKMCPHGLEGLSVALVSLRKQCQMRTNRRLWVITLAGGVSGVVDSGLKQYMKKGDASL
jgi:hypothetical protein